MLPYKSILELLFEVHQAKNFRETILTYKFERFYKLTSRIKRVQATRYKIVRRNEDPEFFTNCLDWNPNSLNCRFKGSSLSMLSSRFVPNMEYNETGSQYSG